MVLETSVLALDKRIRSIVRDMMTPIRFGVVVSPFPELRIRLLASQVFSLNGSSTEIVLNYKYNQLLVFVNEELKLGDHVVLAPLEGRLVYVVLARSNQIQLQDGIIHNDFQESINTGNDLDVISARPIGIRRYETWEIIGKQNNAHTGIWVVRVFRDGAISISHHIQTIYNGVSQTLTVADNGDSTYDINIANASGVTAVYIGRLISTSHIGT